MKYSIPLVYKPIDGTLARRAISGYEESGNGISALTAVMSTVGAVSGAYHGYKRNSSIGWSVGWFFLGALIPYLTIPISLAQGYGKPKDK